MTQRHVSAAPTWPDALYLIACLAPPGCAPAVYEPSAATMGFKAFNLLRMASLGLTVPPAFAIGTSYCNSEASRLGTVCTTRLAAASSR